MSGRDDSVLAERARALAALPPATEATDSRTLLAVVAEGMQLAVPIEGVGRVIDALPPTGVPNAPAWLAGLIVEGGRVIAVIRPAAHLGHAVAGRVIDADLRRDGRARVVLLAHDQVEVGLLVDRVDGVLGATGTTTALPSGTTERVRRVAAGLFQNRLILDVPRLIEGIRDELASLASGSSVVPRGSPPPARTRRET